jgi:transposase
MRKYTFKQFQAEYPTDGACLDRIMQEQYGGTEFSCPACGADSKFHRITKRRAYACQHCGHHVYPCVGTPFEKSRTNLTKWFFAMYLMTSTRHGVAAKELERQIGCTYKCAWRMAHELRKLMATADVGGKLGGHVEIDETLIGGEQKREDARRKGSNKMIVMGIVERNGALRAGPIDDVTMATLEKHVLHHVERGATISTDERRGYNRLGAFGYDHGRVDHSAEEWVSGIHHTNTLEGHWSLLKRAIKGTHTHVSGKHLWKYVAEFSYRYNNRTDHRAMFYRLVDAFSMPRLPAG